MQLYFSGAFASDLSYFANYNIKRIHTPGVNEVQDDDRDGIWDGSGNYTGFSGREVVGLDWEGATQWGVNMTGAVGGGAGASVQADATHEFRRCYDGWRAALSTTTTPHIGFYGHPTTFTQSLHSIDDGLSATTLGQVNGCIELWNRRPVIMPRMYVTYHLGSTDSQPPPASTLTPAGIGRYQGKIIELSMRCAMTQTPRLLVMPYVSREIFNSTLTSGNGAETTYENAYWWTYHAMNQTYLGQKADAMIYWQGSSDPDLNETWVKVFYMAANAVPFQDPTTFPRPPV